MMWAIYKQTIWRHRLSWFIYTGIGMGFIYLYLVSFPTVQAQQATYDQLVNSMPKAILEAFNITQSSPSLMGFLAAKHFGLLWILMAIFLMMSYAGSAIAGEIDRRTMGFLLSLPLSRLKLYAVRLLAGVTGLTIFVAFSALTVWPLARMFNYTAPWIDVAQVSLLGFCFGLAVLGLGMMFSAFASESGKVYALLGGTLLAMYVLNLAAQLEAKFDGAQYFSLFHYFDPGSVIDGGRLGIMPLLVFAGVAIVSVLVGAIAFARRDISV